MQGCLLSPLTMQVASMPLGFISTQASLIFCSTRLVKWVFFQKATAVIVIVNLVHIKIARSRGWGHIRANTPSPLLPQSSVKKGGIFSGTYNICLFVCFVLFLLLLLGFFFFFFFFCIGRFFYITGNQILPTQWKVDCSWVRANMIGSLPNCLEPDSLVKLINHSTTSPHNSRLCTQLYKRHYKTVIKCWINWYTCSRFSAPPHFKVG